MKKLVFSAAVLLAFAGITNAQSTITATATATVITPISISKNTDMSFGNLSVQALTGGTVVLAPEGTRSRTDGVTLPSAAGTVSAATFTVDGSGSSTYAITLPTTVTLMHSGGVQSMDATLFNANTGAGTLSGGTQDIGVGATLTVAGGQLAGVYTSGDFNVTVNYN